MRHPTPRQPLNSVSLRNTGAHTWKPNWEKTAMAAPPRTYLKVSVTHASSLLASTGEPEATPATAKATLTFLGDDCGRYADAALCYEKAIVSAPHAVTLECHLRLGTSLMQLQRFDEASGLCGAQIHRERSNRRRT